MMLRDEMAEIIRDCARNAAIGFDSDADNGADAILALVRTAMLSDKVVKIAVDTHWNSIFTKTGTSDMDHIRAALAAALDTAIGETT